MEYVNDTIPVPPPSCTPEAAVEYNANASDIATEQVGVGYIILHLAELPSRRWLIECGGRSTTHKVEQETVET